MNININKYLRILHLLAPLVFMFSCQKHYIKQVYRGEKIKNSVYNYCNNNNTDSTFLIFDKSVHQDYFRLFLKNSDNDILVEHFDPLSFKFYNHKQVIVLLKPTEKYYRFNVNYCELKIDGDDFYKYKYILVKSKRDKIKIIYSNNIKVKKSNSEELIFDGIDEHPFSKNDSINLIRINKDKRCLDCGIWGYYNNDFENYDVYK